MLNVKVFTENILEFKHINMYIYMYIYTFIYLILQYKRIVPRV